MPILKISICAAALLVLVGCRAASDTAPSYSGNPADTDSGAYFNGRVSGFGYHGEAGGR